MTPRRVNIGSIGFFWSDECLKLFRVIKIRKFCHFYHKVIQIPLSFYSLILIILMQYVFGWNRRNKATRPSLDQSNPQSMKLTEPPVNINLPIFVMSFYKISCIFYKGASSCLIANYPQMNLTIFIVINIKSIACVLWDTLIINYRTFLWYLSLRILITLYKLFFFILFNMLPIFLFSSIFRMMISWLMGLLSLRFLIAFYLLFLCVWHKQNSDIYLYYGKH